MKLYEIANDYRQTMTMYAWEIAEEERLAKEQKREPDFETIQKNWADTFEMLDGDVTEKVEAIGLSVREDAAEIRQIEHEIERLTARKKAIQRSMDGKREYVLYCLKNAGKVRTPLISAYITHRKCAKVADEVQFCKTASERFVRVIPEQREVNRTELMAALKKGENVPGAELVETESVTLR